MTEQEWLTSDDPVRMLNFGTEHPGTISVAASLVRPSYRKLRQWCAAVAWFPVQLDIANLDWWNDSHLEWSYGRQDEYEKLGNDLVEHASDVASVPCNFRDHNGDWTMPQEQKASLLRQIVGNPWRPVTLDGVGIPSQALDLAAGIYEHGDWDGLEPLSDLLVDVSGVPLELVQHLRLREMCWVCSGKGYRQVGMVKNHAYGKEDTRRKISCAGCNGIGYQSITVTPCRGWWSLDLVYWHQE